MFAASGPQGLGVDFRERGRFDQTRSRQRVPVAAYAADRGVFAPCFLLTKRVNSVTTTSLFTRGNAASRVRFDGNQGRICRTWVLRGVPNGERGTDSRRFLRVTGNLDVILQPGQPGAGGVFSVADGDPKPQFSRTRISTKWPEKTVHTREHENGNGSFLRLYPERSPRK